MAADCIARDSTEPNLQPMYNEVSHIVYAATGMETRMTMVGGEVLYQDGRFTRFDYAALREEMRAVRRFVLRGVGRITRPHQNTQRPLAEHTVRGPQIFGKACATAS